MHVNATPCPGCEDKLKQVHPDLVQFFRILRIAHVDCHISCGYRGEADQEEAFKTGHSRAHFGQSAHNTLPAMAIDVFRLTQAGGAAFDMPWYKATIAPIVRGAGFICGGDWKSIKDWPHIELQGFQPFSSAAKVNNGPGGTANGP